MPKRGGEKPWERRENESAQAYEAFVAYLNFGADRSVRAVGQKLGKSRALLERWSAAYDWVARAKAYDAELQRQAYEEAVKAQKKMAARHIKLAVAMQAKATEALAQIALEDIDAKDIVAMMREATKLERETRESLLAAAAPEKNGENASGGSMADTIVAAWQGRCGNEPDK